MAKLILALALASSIGLHWAFFQSLAWTSMLADNLRHDTLADAVNRTFDGHHPCRLCKAIAAGKKSEKKSEAAPHNKTLEFPLVAQDAALTAPARYGPPARPDIFAESLFKTPPTPPPRASVA